MESGNRDGVVFATLKPKFSDASAQLVELMRATLRHAQDICAAVGEAEHTAEQARAAIHAGEAAASDAEITSAQLEMQRLRAAMDRPPPKAKKAKDPEGAGTGESVAPPSPMPPAAPVSAQQAAAAPPPSAGVSEDAGLGGGATGASTASLPAPSDAPDAVGTAASSPTARPRGVAGGIAAEGATSEPGGSGPQSTAAQMSQEIETTVMWVQQLLESVHSIETDTELAPGTSLLSVVQPRLRHSKDAALKKGLAQFHEKKEIEKEEEEQQALTLFRSRALEAVSATRRGISAPMGISSPLLVEG